MCVQESCSAWSGTTATIWQDFATANVVSAIAAVFAASALANFNNWLNQIYYAKMLHRKSPLGNEHTTIEACMFSVMVGLVKLGHVLGIDRKSDYDKLTMTLTVNTMVEEYKDEEHERVEIELTGKQENMVAEMLVGAQNLSVWAMLMPAVYQLVPGSMIAKLWFNSIFPPPLANFGPTGANSTVARVRPASSRWLWVSLSIPFASLLARTEGLHEGWGGASYVQIRKRKTNWPQLMGC